MNRRKAMTLGAGAVVAIAAIIALVVFVVRPGAPTPTDPVATTIPVALSAKDVPADTLIGVVLTLGAETGDGAQWKDAAQGAAVAERRFDMGGTPIAIATRNDKGTVDGARAAVEELIEEGVAGIVVATDGKHVRGALEAATDAGMPLILPYLSGDLETDAKAWRIAPTPAQVSTALTAALAQSERTLLIDAGGGSPAGMRVASTLEVAPGGDAAAVATEAARLTGTPSTKDGQDGQPVKPVKNPADSILLSGTAWQQGVVVQALQSANVAVPIVLTPGATSPAFAGSLQKAGGTLSGRLLTVGADTGDAVALRSDASGRGMSAFLAGLRVLAGDPQAQNLTGDREFAAVAGSADSRSHDAIVALVRAASAAGSNDPKLVGAALETLKVGPADGIAGPVLDFSRREALTGEPVQLNTSVQDLGLRPAAESKAGVSTTAIWFAGNPSS